MSAWHTEGPVTVTRDDPQEWHINAVHGDSRIGHRQWNGMIAVYGCDDFPVDGARIAEANANLIAEAFNVATETGLTPRQLADQRAELLDALRALIARKDSVDPEGLFDGLEDINARAAIAKATGATP
jgi:hypothetical protein